MKDTAYLAYRFVLGNVVTVGDVDGRGHDASQRLEAIAAECTRIRNAMMYDWMSRHRELVTKFAGTDKADVANAAWYTDKHLETLGVAEIVRAQIASGTRTFSKSKIDDGFLVTEAGRAVAKDVYLDYLGCMVKEIKTIVTAKMPWNGTAKAKRKCEAILNFEISLPTFRGVQIPVKNRTLVIAEDGVNIHGESKLLPQIIEHSRKLSAMNGRRRLVVSLPVYNNRRPKQVFELAVHDGFEANIIDSIKSGKCKIGDSKLVQKDDHWELHMSYGSNLHIEVAEEDADRMAYLVALNQSADFPFALVIPAASGYAIRPVGGKAYRDAIKVILTCEKEGRTRGYYYSRYGFGAGHGRKRSACVVNRLYQKSRGLRMNLLKSLVSNVLRTVIQNRCGCLTYIEPTLPSRKISWFSKQKLDNEKGPPTVFQFLWSKFETDLGNKACGKLHSYKRERAKYGDFASNGIPEHVAKMILKCTTRSVQIPDANTFRTQRTVASESSKSGS